MPQTPRKRKKAAEAAPVEVAPVVGQAEPASGPVDGPVDGPAAEPSAELAVEPASAPVVEPLAEPVAELVAGLVAESRADPVAAAPASEPLSAPADAPKYKACKACAQVLPQRAKFCCACGEPQLAGLERPVYLAPVPTLVVEAPPRIPAQTPVPTVPRVAPPRSMGHTVVPSLAADRPIPASLLAPGLTPEQLRAALGAPPVFVPSPPAKAPAAFEANRSVPEPEHVPSPEPEHVPSPEPSPEPDPEPGGAHSMAPLQPQALDRAAPPAESAPAAAAEMRATQAAPAAPAATAAPQPPPLFDAHTDARILALATSREITRERFDRLMVGWRLKPKPKVKAVAPKPAPKDNADKAADQKADKKADKKAKDKPAKGH